LSWYLRRANAKDKDLTPNPTFLGKTLVFKYDNYWEGRQFEEKEVTVYYVLADTEMILLTAIARYGKDFAARRRT
jgi:hypothetical protein